MSEWGWDLSHYEWQLSLCALLAVMFFPVLVKRLLGLVPTVREIQRHNDDVAKRQVQKSFYNPIQNRSKLWGLSTMFGIYALIIPFVITSTAQPWWQMVWDAFVILMVYDFFYYLVHRFVFHNGGPGPGPLMWVHAVHHQQKDPCRLDSNYLHPLETCIGLSLYGATIGLLGALMGDFHVVTIWLTWTAFSEINKHNHDRMDADHFPFRYLNYMAFMHHVHHARFTAGNFATISLFYDWLFGTYDVGNGWGANQRRPAR